MSDILQVTLEAREKSGKQEATKLRNEGYVPAVFYGSGYPESIPVKVKSKDILPAINSGHWETFMDVGAGMGVGVAALRGKAL